jgi:hypothetical protein
MPISRPLAQAILLLLGLVMIVPGCVVEPREGFYDRDHHRWYHDHAWVDCHEQDEHCH